MSRWLEGYLQPQLWVMSSQLFANIRGVIGTADGQ